jgi:NADPH:quinone reductase-like Zn-dependent oxidoreductase
LYYETKKKRIRERKMADRFLLGTQIIGEDVAGEIYEVGPDVTEFKKGDRVIG